MAEKKRVVVVVSGIGCAKEAKLVETVIRQMFLGNEIEVEGTGKISPMPPVKLVRERVRLVLSRVS